VISLEYAGVKQKPPFVVRVAPKAMTKMRAYVDAADGEVGSLLAVSVIPDGFLVEDAFLVEQEAGGADFKFSQEQFDKFAENLFKTDRKLFEKLAGWHHSHVSMGCFWSGTDSDNFNLIGNGNPFTLGIVMTKDGNMRARVDVRLAVGSQRITFDELPILMQYPQEKEEYDAAVADVKAKVKPRTWGQAAFNLNGTYGYYNDEYWDDVEKVSKGLAGIRAKSSLPVEGSTYMAQLEGRYIDFAKIENQAEIDGIRKEIAEMMRDEGLTQDEAELDFVRQLEYYSDRVVPVTPQYRSALWEASGK
jgi:hypothetical protein